jgi:hypothetical protein
MTRLATLVAAMAAAAAVPALAQIYVPPSLGYFVLNTIAPTDKPFVSFAPVNADGGKFWVGRPTAQTCTTLPETCAHIASSTVLWSASNSLNENTTPPAGLGLATLSGRSGDVQHVYVAADGALAYTEPGGDVPADAQVDDAFLYSPEERRNGYGTLVVDGRDFWACSTDKTRKEWQISSGAAGSTPDADCSVIFLSTRPYWSGVSVDYYNTTQS